MLASLPPLLTLRAARRSAASCSVCCSGTGEPGAAAWSAAGERMPLGVDCSEAGVDASGVLKLLSSLAGLAR